VVKLNGPVLYVGVAKAGTVARQRIDKSRFGTIRRLGDDRGEPRGTLAKAN